MAELGVRDYFALSNTHHVVVVSQVGVECKFSHRRLRLTSLPGRSPIPFAAYMPKL
jgi:hypothetical protein